MDSPNSIYLSGDAADTCFNFRKELVNAVNTRVTVGRGSPLLQLAANLEMALRTDLATEGMVQRGDRLEPRDVGRLELESGKTGALPARGS